MLFYFDKMKVLKRGKRMKKVDKKEELLNFIKKYVDDNGYPPTVREMCRAVKVNSTSTIAYHLAKLEDSGSIKKNPNKNRALEVVDNYTQKFAKVITSTESDGLTSIPMLGVITAGEPILAVENCEEYFMVSPNLFRGDGLFMLTVKGESMINAGIFDGDQIIVRQQTYANNGEIVAALIDGSATVKRFYKEDGHYRLQPENDTMSPIIVDECQIIGKVVGLVRKF